MFDQIQAMTLAQVVLGSPKCLAGRIHTPRPGARLWIICSNRQKQNDTICFYWRFNLRRMYLHDVTNGIIFEATALLRMQHVYIYQFICLQVYHGILHIVPVLVQPLHASLSLHCFQLNVVNNCALNP